jgi:hypothetical protein
MIQWALYLILRRLTNGRDNRRDRYRNRSVLDVNLGVEGLEKRLMKLLIAFILIGALVATVVVYSNTKASDKTITEETDYLEREYPRNNNTPPNDFPEEN